MWRKSLRHKGVKFPKAFPAKRLRLSCTGRSVPLSPDAEEAALAWARFQQRDPVRANRSSVRDNFWRDFSKLLPAASSSSSSRRPGECDFGAIARAHLAKPGKPPPAAAAASNSRSTDDVVTIDGTAVPVPNARVDAPGIFVGRGADHKLTGRIRPRLRPADVTLNLSADAPVPTPPCTRPGCRWGGVVHDRSARWIAKWQDPVTGKPRYVYVPASPTARSDSKRKFDEARALSAGFADVVRRNLANLSRAMHSGDARAQQHAACAAIILELGIRVGTAGSQRRAFGAATLLRRHLVAGPREGSFRVSFVGKDGVPYRLDAWRPESAVLRTYLKDLVTSGRASGGDDDARLFQSVTPKSINAYLGTLAPGLTAKVIRTIRANQEFQRALWSSQKSSQKRLERHTKQERSQALSARRVLNQALDYVAAFCNHRTGKDFSKLSRSTTLGNYIDPRTVLAFAQRSGVRMDALVPKGILQRHAWAWQRA